MLMRTDPFRELDRITQQVFGHLGSGSRPAVAPMEAYRQGDEFVVHFDLPGIDPASIDLSLERDVLTLEAERRQAVPDGVEAVVAERPHGGSRDSCSSARCSTPRNIQANYDAGVLTLRIPVLEQAKPRRIEIGAGNAKALTS